jgi:hypothetical protein
MVQKETGLDMGEYGRVNSMQKEAKTIRTSPDSELALLLKEAAAAGTPVVVEVVDTTYTFHPSPTRRPGRAKGKLRSPSPEEVARSRVGIKAAAGSWKDVDAAIPARKTRRSGIITGDDPLFRMIGTAKSGIPGGISGRKYDYFRKAFGSSE